MGSVSTGQVEVRNASDLGKLKDKIGKKVVWCTGPSGSGKDWIATQLNALVPGYMIYLDAAGEIKANKWVIRLDWFIQHMEKAKDVDGPIYVIGSSDNWRQLVYAYCMGSKLRDQVVIFPVPTFELWIKINTAKAEDGESKKLHPAWIADWAAKSKWNRSAYFRYYESKMRLYYEHYAASFSRREFDAEFIFAFTSSEKPIVAGWHGVGTQRNPKKEVQNG